MNKSYSNLDLEALKGLDDYLANKLANYNDQSADIIYRLSEFLKKEFTVIPKGENFARWIFENRSIRSTKNITEDELFEYADLYLKELKDKVNEIKSSTIVNPQLNWNTNKTQLIALFQELVVHGFISSTNTIEDFSAIFDNLNSPKIKIEWIKYSTKNKSINKKSLYDLFYVLINRNFINDVKIEKVINSLFVLPGDKPFNFKSANKAGRERPSEFIQDIEKIIANIEIPKH